MKKILITIVALLATVISVFMVSLIYTPRFATYDEQKKYANEQYDAASNAGEAIFFYAPNIIVGEFSRLIFKKPAWTRAAKSYERLFRMDGARAVEEADVWRGLGDSYWYLQKYDKALNAYRNELEGFKRKYFNKEYPEKAGVSRERIKIEEYAYVIRVQRAIAACYRDKKEYKKQLDEYLKILDYLPDLKILDDHDEYRLFNETFQSIGKMYKIIFKDYDKAVETYQKMAKEFPFSIAECYAEIFIGDTYLAKGDIEKAKAIYNEVIKKYKYPGSTAGYDTAESRLREIDKGQVVAVDGVVYNIKNGKVTVRLI